MKRLARLLIRLYPATWRQRYGDELEALMDDAGPSFASLADLTLGGIRARYDRISRLRFAALLGVFGGLTGLAVSFLFSPVYKATGVLKVSVSGDPDALAHADWQLSEYSLRAKGLVQSRAFLSATIQAAGMNLYQQERSQMPLEEVEEIMRQNLVISISPPLLAHSQTAVFTVDFRYPDPDAATAVVREVISKIAETPYSWKSAQGSGDDAELRARIAALQARIELLEHRLGIPSSTPPSLPLVGNLGHIQSFVVDPPLVPRLPIFPSRSMFTGSGLALGLAIGGILGLLRRPAPPAAPAVI